VFEHKFVEAVTLLTALGASRIAVQQEEGEPRDREWTSAAAGLGFTRTSRMCGVNLDGKFQQQHDTIWRLDAEFPGLAD
jgi:hypothetical protein